MALPNFIVIGAAKSGTTSLWHYLISHPDIYMSEIKETNYFSNDLMNRNNPIKTMDDYESLFKGKENYKQLGEVSNSYLTYAEDVAPRIKKAIPECKIIVILRHPVDRLYSRYWHAVRDQYIKESFLEFSSSTKSVEKISKKLKVYWDLFGVEKVKVIFLEELENDIKKFSKDLFSFLDINLINLQGSHLNQSGSTRSKLFNDFILNGSSLVRSPAKILPPKYRAKFREYIKRLNTKSKPKIDSVLKESLENYYEEDIKILESCVGRLPDSWLKRLRG